MKAGTGEIISSEFHEKESVTLNWEEDEECEKLQIQDKSIINIEKNNSLNKNDKEATDDKSEMLSKVLDIFIIR